MNIEVKDTDKYGKSIFAARDFKKDDVVFTACGPIVKVPTRLTFPIDHGLFIDPAPTDNPALYLNHSCEPSCGIKNRTEIVAMRDIAAREEITIDYAMIVPRYQDEMTAENRVCTCGADTCRGQLGAFEELSEELKKKYSGYISDYLTG